MANNTISTYFDTLYSEIPIELRSKIFENVDTLSLLKFRNIDRCSYTLATHELLKRTDDRARLFRQKFLTFRSAHETTLPNFAEISKPGLGLPEHNAQGFLQISFIKATLQDIDRQRLDPYPIVVLISRLSDTQPSKIPLSISKTGNHTKQASNLLNGFYQLEDLLETIALHPSTALDLFIISMEDLFQYFNLHRDDNEQIKKLTQAICALIPYLHQASLQQIRDNLLEIIGNPLLETHDFNILIAHTLTKHAPEFIADFKDYITTLLNNESKSVRNMSWQVIAEHYLYFSEHCDQIISLAKTSVDYHRITIHPIDILLQNNKSSMALLICAQICSAKLSASKTFEPVLSHVIAFTKAQQADFEDTLAAYLTSDKANYFITDNVVSMAHEASLKMPFSSETLLNALLLKISTNANSIKICGTLLKFATQLSEKDIKTATLTLAEYKTDNFGFTLRALKTLKDLFAISQHPPSSELIQMLLNKRDLSSLFSPLRTIAPYIQPNEQAIIAAKINQIMESDYNWACFLIGCVANSPHLDITKHVRPLLDKIKSDDINIYDPAIQALRLLFPAYHKRIPGMLDKLLDFYIRKNACIDESIFLENLLSLAPDKIDIFKKIAFKNNCERLICKVLSLLDEPERQKLCQRILNTSNKNLDIISIVLPFYDDFKALENFKERACEIAFDIVKNSNDKPYFFKEGVNLLIKLLEHMPQEKINELFLSLAEYFTPERYDLYIINSCRFAAHLFKYMKTAKPTLQITTILLQGIRALENIDSTEIQTEVQNAARIISLACLIFYDKIKTSYSPYNIHNFMPQSKMMGTISDLARINSIAKLILQPPEDFQYANLTRFLSTNTLSIGQYFLKVLIRKALTEQGINLPIEAPSTPTSTPQSKTITCDTHNTPSYMPLRDARTLLKDYANKASWLSGHPFRQHGKLIHRILDNNTFYSSEHLVEMIRSKLAEPDYQKKHPFNKSGELENRLQTILNNHQQASRCARRG